MDHRTPRALAAAAALALALGACTDVPTSAPARITSAGPATHTVSASGATLIPNTVKYRDKGGKPATGRSGSAALQAFALVGKDGVTELSLKAVSVDPWEWRPGTITHARVRALDVDSTLMFSLNRNNVDALSHREQFTTLMRGQYLQVQANVTGLDPHRTDVVTVTERVKRRPDVAVTLHPITPRVSAYRPVPIHATVSELNGDVGAVLTCMLLVDGAPSDQAYGVWVDAGDAVTCAFTQGFAPGTHDVQVEVSSVQPADWDEANNRSEVVRIEAAGGPAEFNYYADVSATRVRDTSRQESSWYNYGTGIRGESRDDWSHSEDSEFAFISGWAALPVSGEVTFDVSQTTGGRVVHSDTWTDLVEGCTFRWREGASFFLCSSSYGGIGETFFDYSWTANAVTYHSSSYAREWDELTGEDVYYYHYNYSTKQGYGDVFGFGNDYAFRVRLTSGGTVVTAESDLALEHTAFVWSDSWCNSSYNPWDGFASEQCWAGEQKRDSWTGTDSKTVW